jgi:hypothetical protein
MDNVPAPPSPVDRIAGAPISWGVCEVPDWGYQLAPSRVLAEMSEVGLAATESVRRGSCLRTPPRWPPSWPPTA